MPALRRHLTVFAVLAAAFMTLTVLVAAGGLNGFDRLLSASAERLWSPPAGTFFQGLALLGGVEAATLLTLAMGVYLWRAGFRSEIWALLALPATVLLDLLYKRQLAHPGPPAGLAHGDGPSLTDLVGGEGGVNSFPSGHMARAVLVFGLLAFLLRRLAGRRWHRAAPAVAAAIILAMAFDRVYLQVHWASDVLGGLLLGGICLLGAIIWLDRPVPEGS